MSTQQTGWSMIRGKYLLREVDVRSMTGEETLLSLSKDRGIVPRGALGFDGGGRADTLVGYKQVSPGMIVMNKMQAWNGMFGLAGTHGIVSPEYTTFVPLEGMADPRFMVYMLRSDHCVGEFSWRSRGMGTAFLRLHPEQLLATPFFVPDVRRQRAIADHLDIETARIDALIANQSRSILLLEERLSARVQDVLSHGPLVALKRLVDPSRPITYGIVQAGPAVDGGVPYIRPVDMDGHEGVRDVASLLTTTPDIAESYRRSRLREGDLVVSIGPSFGKTMVVPPELSGANLTQGTARVAPRADVDVWFLRWALRSQTAVDHWEASVGGATFRALNLAPLSMTPVPYLPLNEQIAAARQLDLEEQWSRNLTIARRALIDLLKERRETLIARAVSGELELPGAA